MNFSQIENDKEWNHRQSENESYHQILCSIITFFEYFDSSSIIQQWNIEILVDSKSDKILTHFCKKNRYFKKQCRKSTGHRLIDNTTTINIIINQNFY